MTGYNRSEMKINACNYELYQRTKYYVLFNAYCTTSQPKFVDISHPYVDILNNLRPASIHVDMYRVNN